MEVTAEKPGNVSPSHDFPDTKFHHFLASSVALGRPMHRLAEPDGLDLGEGILEAVRQTNSVQSGGNTHLGTILLFAPIAMGAGQVKGDFTKRKLKNAIVRVLKGSTNEDAIEAYNAINFAPVGGLNEVPELDVRDHETLDRIKTEGISLLEWMAVGSRVNTICYEYDTGFRLCFEVALPVLVNHAPTKMDRAILHTFLTLLAVREDSHITGEFGEGVAEDVREWASTILEKGSVWKRAGETEIRRMASDLRRREINPGTTADLTAATIFLALLLGLEI